MSDEWIIWSNEHSAFWKANRHGYTRLIADAGRYSKEEAEAICRDANPRAWGGLPPEIAPEICMPAPEAMDAAIKIIDDLLAHYEEHRSDEAYAAYERACAFMGE